GEWSYREMKTPFTNANDLTNVFAEIQPQNEYEWRGYLFWAPHDWVALRSALIYELFKTAALPSGLSAQPLTLTTYPVPLGINTFHPYGFRVASTRTDLKQEGSCNRQNGVVQSGSSSFWTFDTALTYRMPNRYGLLTVGIQNMFDKSFNFFDRDVNNPI